MYLTLQEAKACYVPESIKKDRKQLYSLRNQFISKFTREYIARMDVDDYVEGKGNSDSFCYWIERKLDRLGSVRGAYATMFGLYYSDSNKDYWYAKKYGDDYKSAFKAIKDEILDLLDAGCGGKTERIVDNRLAPMFKGKILSLYYPDEYLNIFSKKHLIHYLKVFNLDTVELLKKDSVYLREALLRFKNADKDMKSWDNDVFGCFLYTYFAPNDLDDECNMIFPTTDDFTYVEGVSLADAPEEVDSKRKGKKKGGQKINYDEELRKCRKIGERGEQIVMIAERIRLKELGYGDKVIDKKLVQISKYDDSCGYDILSLNSDGSARYIEVKATVGKVGDMSFYYTINELNTAKEKGDDYFIYIVYDIQSKKPKIWCIQNPFMPNCKMKMSPIQFRVDVYTQNESGDL